MLVLTDPQPGSSELAYVAKALASGGLVVLPTDTVYGIAASAADEQAVRRLYELKGRDAAQPTAVIYPNVATLREELPWLSTRASWAVVSLLPGPWTLIVNNPEGVMPWLTGGAPGPIGLRVPTGALELPPIAATSANRAGEPTISDVRELDPDLASGLACAVTAREFRPDQASTVLDLCAWERGEDDVRIVRDDAARAGQALAVLANAPV